MNKPPLCPVCNSESLYDFSSRDLMFDLHEKFDYYRCQNCNFVFQNPIPSPEKISSFYPNNYDIYEENSRTKQVSSLRKSILKKYYGYDHLQTLAFFDLICPIIHKITNSKAISFISNGKLLDVGCGNGRYLDGMKKLGWDAHGVEFNAHAVSVCKMSNLEVHLGDLFSAEFEDETFDVINVSHVIEHVPNPKGFFSELSRVLKKGGTLIIKTPNSNALGRALFNSNWFPNEVPRHLQLFSEANLKQLSQVNQLEIIEITTRSSVKFILNSIDYVIDNKGTPSKKVKWRRLVAKSYAFISTYKKRGDEIFSIFKKM